MWTKWGGNEEIRGGTGICLVFPDSPVLWEIVMGGHGFGRGREDPHPVQTVSRHAGGRRGRGRLHVPGDAVELRPRISQLREDDGTHASRCPGQGTRGRLRRRGFLAVSSGGPPPLARDAHGFSPGPSPGIPSAGIDRRGPFRREGGAGKADRKSTRLNSSHGYISYAVFCLKK